VGFIVKEKLPSVQMVRDLTPSFGTLAFPGHHASGNDAVSSASASECWVCGSRNETGF
jgi:hypothetical protein